MADPRLGKRSISYIGGIEENRPGQAFEFWFEGRKHTWTLYPSDGRYRFLGYSAPPPLVGSYARGLLSDPLWTTLIEALARQRKNETDAERADRLMRARRRDAIAAADRDAKARPARKRDW